MQVAILSDAHLFHRKSSVYLYKKTILDLQDKVDIIVDCGDIVDRNYLDAVAAQELFNLFKLVRIPFYIVRGNHDTLSEQSLSSILGLNPNIHVYNDIHCEQIDNKKFYFIPYSNDIKQIIQKLKLNDIAADFAFSHLNITDHFYSDINTKRKAEFLCLYADKWFNGHIHEPELFVYSTGTIRNVGSFSSLTFSDEHIPCYSILDTVTGNTEQFEIKDSIIHKTLSYDMVYTAGDILKQEQYKEHQVCWRIKISGNVDYKERDLILLSLKKYPQTKEIVFSYEKSQQVSADDILNETFKFTTKPRSIMQQLIEEYENDSNIKLNTEIRGLLLND